MSIDDPYGIIQKIHKSEDTNLASVRRKAPSPEKYNQLLSYNFNNELMDLSNDIRHLKLLERQKSQLDKRQTLLYGGQGIFPSQDKLDQIKLIGQQIK